MNVSCKAPWQWRKLSLSVKLIKPNTLVVCVFCVAGSSVRTQGLVKLSETVFVFPAAACPVSHRQAPALILFFSNPDIVHENLKMGSDGESDQASGTSSDEVQSPTGVCLRNRGNRRISAEVRFVPVCSCCHCMASHCLKEMLSDAMMQLL